jgi:murein DD-endopeptidase MepM/ murein hydrolase activator NlpD
VGVRGVAGVAAAALVLPAATSAAGSADVAALQVALRAKGAYAGTVDGVPGPSTTNAVVRFQKRVGLAADGVAGPRTRRALGRLGAPRLGSRTLRLNAVGADVAALQFALAWQGAPSGPFDGRFGPRLQAALRRFQEARGLLADGIAGATTVAALRSAPGALARVTFAGFHAGGYGNLVVVAHGNGLRTLYGHLSSVSATVGLRVAAGAVLGLVGSTGHATGPHLHFEARLRGLALDPLPALAR